ncbi:phage replisome organizer N-terminal domain-containing protein [Enterococcus faecium]|uniref:phage replisome organizer N-terminal domain-containing protein n=1 Tax=Enterococcus faecium TaxID=1352 RepID=UPI0001CEB52F|nr:phage replisome organizer N-terminal domain-containing protein [Enterococcus faecium]EFF25857.1 phage protein [Enterococcus faecium E1679]
MSDNKRYYYLKLKENFFDSDEMVLLESMPDGYIYSNILLKLYLRSLKHEGKLMFNDRIPFNSTMLATITRHSVGVVEKAVQIFRDLQLIDVLDNGAIYMSDIQSFIGKSSTEADRKREYRKKIEEAKRNLITGGQVSDKCPDKTTPELEIELEKDIENVTPSKKSKAKPVRHKYGEYKNVLLSGEQMEKLKTEFPNDYQERIERLSEYCESSGKTYKNYLATIRSWARKEKSEPKNASSGYKRTGRREKLPEWAIDQEAYQKKKALERANRQSKAPF